MSRFSRTLRVSSVILQKYVSNGRGTEYFLKENRAHVLSPAYRVSIDIIVHCTDVLSLRTFLFWSFWVGIPWVSDLLFHNKTCKLRTWVQKDKESQTVLPLYIWHIYIWSTTTTTVYSSWKNQMITTTYIFLWCMLISILINMAVCPVWLPKNDTIWFITQKHHSCGGFCLVLENKKCCQEKCQNVDICLLIALNYVTTNLKIYVQYVLCFLP